MKTQGVTQIKEQIKRKKPRVLYDVVTPGSTLN